MNENEKEETGLEKAIKKLKQIKEEAALSRAINEMNTYKETLKDFKKRIVESLEKGQGYFKASFSYERDIAKSFFKKINVSVLSGYIYNVYIDEKGLKKLNKELKKLDMEGL